MFLVLIGAMGLVNWPKGEAPWWEKIVNGYGVIVAVFGCVVLFVVLGNRRVRRNRARNSKADGSFPTKPGARSSTAAIVPE